MRYAPRAFASSRTAHLAEFNSLDAAKRVAYAELVAEEASGPLVIFSREPWTTSASRLWCIASFAEAANWIQRQKPDARRVHEWLNPDVEVRMVADLERKHGEHDDRFPNGPRDLVACAEEFQRRLTEALQLPAAPRMVLVSGSRADKDSVHVHCPDLVLKNWRDASALGVFVGRASEREDTLLYLVLDFGFYARSGGTLRTVYSTGCDKETWLVPMEDAAAQDTSAVPFARAKWLETLVTFVPPDAGPALELPEHIRPPAVETPAVSVAAPLPAAIIPSAFSKNPSAFDAASDLMVNIYETTHAAHACEADQGTGVVTGANHFGFFFRKFPCALKRAPHRGNCVLVMWHFAASDACAPPPPGVYAQCRASHPRVTRVAMQCQNPKCKKPRWEAGPHEVDAVNRAVARAIRDHEARESATGPDDTADAALRAPPTGPVGALTMSSNKRARSSASDEADAGAAAGAAATAATAAATGA